MFSHQLNRRLPKTEVQVTTLQDAIAVTQNFCNEWNAASVSSTECDGLIRFWRKKNGVVFHLWKLHLIHELFINDSVRIPYIYCGQYMLSFLSDFSFHSWNVGSLSSPQVWRCAKATHPLLARQLRERLEEHCSREAVLPGDDPTQSYLYLGVFLTSLTLIYEKISRGFSTTNLKEGLAVYGRWLLILYNLLCLLSLLGGRGLWLSIDWPDNVAEV